MNISSKLKKIISFMLVAVLAVSAVALPVSADETTEETEHKTRFDMEVFPEYTKADLEYTGEVSTNLKEKFNIVREYDMSFTKQDYYISRPFTFGNWLTMPDSMSQAFSQSWLWNQFNIVKGEVAYLASANYEDYDIYYVLYSGRHNIHDYYIAGMIYYLVPHGAHIAICNDDDNGNYPGVYVKDSSLWKNNGNDIAHSVITIERRLDDGERIYKGVLDTSVDGRIVQWADQQLIASNIPVFDYRTDVLSYLNSQQTLHDPHGKVPGPELGVNDGNKLSADSFGWDSFKCRLSQVNNAYKFIYDYSYSSQIMKNDPSSFYMDIEYSQVIRYRNKLNMGAYADKTASKKSNLLVTSSGTSTDSMAVMDTKGSFGQQFIYSVCLLVDEASSFFGSGTDLSNIEIYSSTIYVTVVLKHKRFGSSPSRNDSFSNALCDISSDVRTFKFNALDLSNLDNPDTIQSDVSVKDIVDSNGNTKKEVSQIITNDDSTHTTINNYYYNSDGKQSSSPDGSDTLSDILSTLIKFIKTLVTEGLPAALEILQTLIKSLSSMISSALDGLNVGEGSSNGIIAVLKCIPASCWSLVVIAVIILVVVGVLKHIF